jgi:hypothetical protein
LGGLIGGGILNPDIGKIYDTYDYVWVNTKDVFGIGLFGGYDFGLFTGQLEFRFTTDRAEIDTRYTVWDSYWNGSWWVDNSYTVHEQLDYRGKLLQIPLIVKVDLHLWRFVLQPLAGLYLNFGLGMAESHGRRNYNVGWDNPLLGWVAGGTVGFHLGPGFLFTEVRHMANFGNTKVGGVEAYRRSATLFSGGYQYYLQTPAKTPAAQQSSDAEQTPALGLPAKGFFLGGLIGGGILNPDIGKIYDTYDYVWVHDKGAFDAGLFAGYDFGLFTGQLEFLFTTDRAEMDVRNEVWISSGGGGGYFNTVYDGDFDYRGKLLQIPLIAKVDLHLGRFVLQPLAGLYLNFGLGMAESHRGNNYNVGWDNPLLGWVAGGTIGFHLGPGFLFTEVRRMANFGNTKVGGAEAYRRSATLFNFGYQYYFK